MKKEEIIEKLDKLTDNERLIIFERYCSSCGQIQPEEGRKCQCSNDE